MPTRFVLVADPPHGNVDIPGVAALVKLLPVDIRGTVAHTIPSPWVVSDETAARALERDLNAKGVRCVAVRAGEIARVPAAMDVDEFTIGDSDFGWSARGGAGSLAWTDIAMVTLYKRVAEQAVKASEAEKKIAGRMKQASDLAKSLKRYNVASGGIIGKLGAAAADVAAPASSRTDMQLDEVLEIAGASPGGPLRARLVKSGVSYKGLGRLLAPVAHTNWITLVKTISERARNAQMDRRGERTQVRPLQTLEKVSLHKIFAGGPPRLAEIASDPFEFFGSFVCWQKGLLTAD